MANVLNKDPFTYGEDRRSFLQDLQRFHASRGTPFDRIPEIAGKPIDLYRLYRRVIDLGGWQKVNNDLLWEDIQEEFKVPLACTNGSQALKYTYFRYLNIYEKVHFLGLDPDSSRDDQEDGPARKKVCLPMESIPLTYNYNHHKVQDNQRSGYRLSTSLAHFSDYEKVEMSLRSGLPNEVDFALNCCLLLSYDTPQFIKLNKTLHLLPLLMANVGIFEEGPGTMEDVMSFSWNSCEPKRDFLRFWHDTVNDKQIRENLKTKNGIYEREELVGSEVLNLGRELGVKDAEGQRITQVAILIRNLSFEEVNQQLLASNQLIFRFLILSVHSTYGSLRQMALDTLGNLAAQMVLQPVEATSTQVIMNLIKKSLHEDDKFVIVRALEVVSKLCQLEKNEAVLTESVGEEAYVRMVQLLTVHDIQLIVHTLEALYQLSELGAATTDTIASVRNAVDLLVNLITVEAQSYGPNSLVGIKVVEYVPPPDPKAAATPSATPTHPPPSRTVIQSIAPSQAPAGFVIHASSQPPSADQAKTDIEITASNWLQATFEGKKGSSITQADLFADFQQFCRKFGVADVLTAADFSTIVKSAIPHTSVSEVDKGGGEKEPVIKGLCRRAQPRPFAILAGSDRAARPPSAPGVSPRGPGPSAWPFAPNPLLPPPSHTPTLRQRLMEPPRAPLQSPLGPDAGATGAGAPSTPKGRGQTGKAAGGGRKKPTAATPAATPGPGRISPCPVNTALQPLSTPQRPPSAPPVSIAAYKPAPQAMSGAVQPSSRDSIGVQASSYRVPVSALQAIPHPSTPTPVAAVSASGQNFPLIHQALQADALPPKSGLAEQANDTNLIKSLLAKKVCQNMVRQGNGSPSVSPPPPDSPMSGVAEEECQARAPEASHDGTMAGSQPSSVQTLSSQTLSQQQSVGQPQTVTVPPAPQVMVQSAQAGPSTKQALPALSQTQHTLSSSCQTHLPPQQLVNVLQQQVSSSQVHVLQHQVTASQVNMVQPQVTGSQVNVIQPQVTGSQVNMVQPQVTGSQVNLVQQQIPGSQVNVLQQQVTGTQVNMVHHINSPQIRMLQQQVTASPVTVVQQQISSPHVSTIQQQTSNLAPTVQPSSTVQTPLPAGQVQLAGGQGQAVQLAGGQGQAVQLAGGQGQAVQLHVQPSVGQPQVLQLPQGQQVIVHQGAAPQQYSLQQRHSPALQQIVVRPQQQIIVQQTQPHMLIQNQPLITHIQRIQTQAQPPVVIQLPLYQLGASQVGSVCATTLPTTLVQTSRALIPQAPSPAPLVAPPLTAAALVNHLTAGSVQSEHLGSGALASVPAERRTVDQLPRDVSVLQGCVPSSGLAPGIVMPSPQQLSSQVLSRVSSVIPHPPSPSPSPQQPSSMSITQALLSGQDPRKSAPNPLPPSHISLESQSCLKNSGRVNGNNNNSLTVGRGACNGVSEGGEVNGVLGSPDSVSSDFPPSPVCQLPNGVGEAKDLLDSVADKAGKLNGLLQHAAANGEVWPVNGLSPHQQPPLPSLSKQASVEEVSLDSTDSKLLNGSHPHTPRPLFSPDPSHDSDLSCDSFASSIADSVSSDKHSCAPVAPHSFPKPAATAPTSTHSLMSSVFPEVPLVLAGTVPTAEAATKRGRKKATPKPKAERPPSKSKRRKNAAEAAVNPAAAMTMEYMCEWAGCRRCFDSARLVFIHVTKSHVPHVPESVCQWYGCEPLRRKRWSLVTHVQDHHCSEGAQRAGCQRRFLAAQQATSPAPQTPTTLQQAPALVYPPDAALQAIKRFQIRKPYLELTEQREGPVTKHIRLTSALILRNLARFSPHGRSLIKHYERQLSYVTMSTLESSTALSTCLWEILHDT